MVTVIDATVTTDFEDRVTAQRGGVITILIAGDQLVKRLTNERLHLVHIVGM